jgi:class 3 adenylate cyclase/tetratricopeptide (TPR) repeat protein
MDAAALWTRWQQCRVIPACPADIHLKLGEAILQRGEPILAYDVLSRGMACLDGQRDLAVEDQELLVRLRQLCALALAQSGATERARGLLVQLCEEGHDDPETLGLLGRVYKDLASLAKSETERGKWLKEAWRSYHRGFEKGDRAYQTVGQEKAAAEAFYCGINSAAVQVLRGHLKAARVAAARVREICEARLAGAERAGSEGDYWLRATLGEAELICGRYDEARKWYKAAVALASGNWRELSSTRRQLRLLAGQLGEPVAAWDALFPQASVCVFSSPPWDNGTRTRACPSDWGVQLRKDLDRRLHDAGVIAGYVGAGLPADLVFAEALLGHGAEVHVVLPYLRGLCREKLAANRDWQRRFDLVLSRATTVTDDTEKSCLDESVNARFAALRAYGSACLRANRLEVDLRRLGLSAAPWSKEGGAGSLLAENWKREGCVWESLPGQRAAPQTRATADPLSKSSAPAAGAESHAIRSMLFADIKGYSRLDDAALFRFSRHWFGEVARLLASHRDRILSRRTAGDGLFLVFADIDAAAEVAIALRNHVVRTSWSALGLPPQMGIRISLDAGPVYTVQDLVTGRTEVCGTYVNRAARIEPITPPNEVYASEAFAALYVATGGAGFRFDYVGQTELPKGFGLTPLYCVVESAAGPTAKARRPEIS